MQNETVREHRFMQHPHFNIKLLWQLRILFTVVFAHAYWLNTDLNKTSGIPFFLIAHSNTFHGILSKPSLDLQNMYTTFVS